jgi:hypothetical protein
VNKPTRAPRPGQTVSLDRTLRDNLARLVSEDDRITDRAAIRNLPDDDETITRVVQRVHAALNSGRDAAVVKVVLDETERLRDELALVRDTLEKRTESHGRLVATIGRVRAAVSLIEPDEITPQGARMIRAALDPQP